MISQVADSGQGEGVRGVIDAIEEGWARLALDDGQRLDWPVDRLPSGAAQGMAVVLSLEEKTGPSTWVGVRHAPTAPGGLWARIRRALGLADGGQEAEAHAAGRMAIALGAQRLEWPDLGGHAAGEPVVVRMRVDADDTEQRRRHVQGLVDDLFG